MKKRIVIIALILGILSISWFPRIVLAKNEKSTPVKPSPAVTASVLQATHAPSMTPPPHSVSTQVSPTKTVPTPTKKASPSISQSQLKKPTITPTPTIKVRIPGQIAAATVTSIKGSTITVTKEKKTFTILVTGSTLFRKHYWGSSTLQDTSVNDKVNITGNFINQNKTIMEASLIRNLSILKRRGVIFGTITLLTPTSLSLKPKDHPLQKVYFSKNTVLVNRREAGMILSDLKVGDQIRVKGLWDRGINTITEVTQIKDFSSPMNGSPSATKK